MTVLLSHINFNTQNPAAYIHTYLHNFSHVVTLPIAPITGRTISSRLSVMSWGIATINYVDSYGHSPLLASPLFLFA